MNPDRNFTEAEYMIINMARMLKEAENAFMGVASNLPFFAIWLAKELYNPDLVWLNIPGRVDPHPLTPPKSTVDSWFTNKPSSSLTLADIFDMSARGELDITFLSGVQIDRFGNFNLSHITKGDKKKIQFTGGAGSALLCATSKRVILWRTKHDKRAFIDRCSVNTATGNIYRVVTPISIFKRENGVLNLESINSQYRYEYVVQNTGFPVDDAPHSEDPTEDELGLLRDFDTYYIRNIEF